VGDGKIHRGVLFSNFRPRWLTLGHVVPENSIRRDSRGEAELAHHPMRCLRSSICADYEPWASATSPLPRARLGAYAERLIGTIRRECLDHMIVFGEAHLRRILSKYAVYYNDSRIHRALNKDAPFHRAIERVGAITSRPVLGGLHHQYCRI
jgi:hypothetical protein